tara:strand:- start:219 stop:371 length:153 start_codon:yes stop_codon:yes gene_type:complete
MDFILENWVALVIATLSFTKVIINLTPSDRDNKVFGYIDDLLNYFIKNRK